MPLTISPPVLEQQDSRADFARRISAGGRKNDENDFAKALGDARPGARPDAERPEEPVARGGEPDESVNLEDVEPGTPAREMTETAKRPDRGDGSGKSEDRVANDGGSAEQVQHQEDDAVSLENGHVDGSVSVRDGREPALKSGVGALNLTGDGRRNAQGLLRQLGEQAVGTKTKEPSAELEPRGAGKSNTDAGAAGASSKAVTVSVDVQGGPRQADAHRGVEAVQPTVIENLERSSAARVMNAEARGEQVPAGKNETASGGLRRNSQTPTEHDAGTRPASAEKAGVTAGAGALNQIDRLAGGAEGAAVNIERGAGADASLGASGMDAKADRDVVKELRRLFAGTNVENRSALETMRPGERTAPTGPNRGETALPAVKRAEQVNTQVMLENTSGSLAASVGMDGLLDSVPGGASKQVNSNDVAVKAMMPAGADVLMGPHSEDADQMTTQQVVRGFRAMMNQHGGAMTIRMSPPELGDLRIQMTISHGAVAAELHAASAPVRELLERNLPMLQRSLEAQGLSVERLAVNGPSAGNAQSQTGHGDQSGGGSDLRREANAGEGQSRGRQEQQPSFAQQHRQQREEMNARPTADGAHERVTVGAEG